MEKNVFTLTGIMGTAILLFSLSIANVQADYKYNYYDHDEIVTLLEGLETASASLTPDVFSLQIIGYSHLGNPIHIVKFSDNPDTEEDAEPDVVIDSGIHSNEWIATESNINFIQYLFDVYYDDQHADHTEVVDLVHNFEIWILPMINPDGRLRDDESGGDPESFWTDTTYHSGDATGWRMNVQEVACPAKPGGTNIGIDLNRTWSRRFWEFSNCEANYHGEAPFDPTETKVYKQFINNHMVSLVLHQHSAIGVIFSNSMTTGLGRYITVEMDAAYEAEGLLDPLLTITNELEMAGGGGGASMKGSEYINESDSATGTFLAGACDGMGQTGQYFNWLWYEIDCILSSDHGSKRGIQCVFYEYHINADIYGHTSEEGKIGQYLQGDASIYNHPSSGDVVTWTIDRSVEINKYVIKQSLYPFSPRYFSDMSLRPEAPTTDLAIVGAKISEVGTGLPGCFTYDEDDGRDLLELGSKRITWNVQNNGTSSRTIDSDITICNLTDDPECLSPTTNTQQRTGVSPETIETFTYDHDFEHCRDYSVTLTTGEDNEYLNDNKIFIFTVISTGDADCDGSLDVDDNCPGIPNDQLDGTCTSGSLGDPCTIPGNNESECGTSGFCSMNQEDSYPPQGNDIGDACDCEGDFDCSGGVDATDVTTFLTDFGRSPFSNPCTDEPKCKGDFNCDLNVDAADVTVFLEDFGRSAFSNPCPACVSGPWCLY